MLCPYTSLPASAAELIEHLMSDTTFSKRHGFIGSAKEITIREDAPERLRYVILDLATRLGIRPSPLREIVCSVLKQRPDPNNWSEYPNVWGEWRTMYMSVIGFMYMISSSVSGPI